MKRKKGRREEKKKLMYGCFSRAVTQALLEQEVNQRTLGYYSINDVISTLAKQHFNKSYFNH